MPEAATSPSQIQNAAVLHDAVQVRLLGLMVADTFQWKHSWAQWRIRFHVDNDIRDTNYVAICSFVRDRVISCCAHRVEAADIVLYVADLRDAKAIFRIHGATLQAPGLISALQSRASYEEAVAFAAELAAEMRKGPGDDDGNLPDLHWVVLGAGLTRVATTRVQGHTVVVRMGDAARLGQWVVNVDDREACAQYRSRGDAMSKMGVAAALAAHGAARKVSAPAQAWR
jgi:hypothetical protein